MFSPMLWPFHHSLALVPTLCLVLSLPSPILAQVVPGIAGSSPEDENRKEPLRIKMSGFLNTKPEEGSLAVVTLGISAYNETYQFDVGSLEAPDYPRLSPTILLQRAGKHHVDFNLIGPKDLLSKIGQAEPGTPLALDGLFYPYNRNFRLDSVQVIGMDKY
jgi:hypothetical protein